MAAQLSAGLVIITNTAVVAGFVVGLPAGEPTGRSVSVSTRAVRGQVIVARSLWFLTLVQQFVVVGAKGERLVRIARDDIAMADVIRPRCTAVRLAGERVRRAGHMRGLEPTEGGNDKGAEVVAIRALGFDDLEVLVLALDGVHLYRLEDVLLGVGHDDRGRRAELAGKVADGHTDAVDLAIVVGGKRYMFVPAAMTGWSMGRRWPS
jgi:hypothetical protein